MRTDFSSRKDYNKLDIFLGNNAWKVFDMSMVLILLTNNIWSWIIHQGTQLSLVLARVQYSGQLSLLSDSWKMQSWESNTGKKPLKGVPSYSLRSLFDLSSQEWKLMCSGFEEYQHFPVNNISSLQILNISIIQGFPVFIFKQQLWFSLWTYSARCLYVICSRKGLD